MSTRTLVVILVAIGLTLGLPLAAAAQAKADKVKKDKADQMEVVVVRGPGGMKTYRIKKLVIFGTRHRPHAVYMLNRSRLGFDWSEPRQKLVPRILPTVRRHPF
jgi:hypothetical protein